MPLNKRRKFLILTAFLVITSTPFVVEASKTPEKEDYVLKLSASLKSGTATITLKATFTLVTESWLNVWVSKSSPVDNSIIHFYSCDKKGRTIKELGKAETNKNGISTFLWSANHNGDYWFVAEFISKSGHEYDSLP